MSHFIIELLDFLVMKRLDLIITNMDLGNLGSTQNPIITFQYISYGCVWDEHRDSETSCFPDSWLKSSFVLQNVSEKAACPQIAILIGKLREFITH